MVAVGGNGDAMIRHRVYKWCLDEKEAREVVVVRVDRGEVCRGDEV